MTVLVVTLLVLAAVNVVAIVFLWRYGERRRTAPDRRVAGDRRRGVPDRRGVPIERRVGPADRRAGPADRRRAETARARGWRRVLPRFPTRGDRRR